MKNLMVGSTAIALLFGLSGCSNVMKIEPALALPSVAPGEAIAAVAFPELKITTTEGKIYRGKVISLRGDIVTIRPSPYWNVPEVVLTVNDLYRFENIPTKDNAGKGFLSGFSVFFIPVGAIGLAYCRYNTDFQLTALTSLAGGVVFGLIGAASNAIERRPRVIFEFPAGTDQMVKRTAILKTMGYRDERS